MSRRATGQIEGFGSGNNQRMYLPARISSDSTHPFEPGDAVRYQLVETACERDVLVVTSDALEVDLEATSLELRRSTTEVQTDLQEVSE